MVMNFQNSDDEKRICDVTGKTCLSQRRAGDIMMTFKKQRQWNNRGKHIPLRSYFCKYCGTYHLTHFRGRPRKITKGDDWGDL